MENYTPINTLTAHITKLHARKERTARERDTNHILKLLLFIFKKNN